MEAVAPPLKAEGCEGEEFPTTGKRGSYKGPYKWVNHCLTHVLTKWLASQIQVQGYHAATKLSKFTRVVA